jgi:hypothetical protein
MLSPTDRSMALSLPSLARSASSELRGALLDPLLELLARLAQLFLGVLQGGHGALEFRIDAFEPHRGLLPRPLEEVGECGDHEKGGDEAQFEIQRVCREGARRVLPHEEGNGRDEHHKRSGKPRPGAEDKRRDQGKGKIPDVGRVVHPTGEEQIVIEHPDDTDAAEECRLVVLRPAQVDDQAGEDKCGAEIQSGEPGVSLEVGKRAQQDEVEDADHGEGVEDDDLA